MRGVYASGTEKPPPPSAMQKSNKPTTQGNFFSSLFSSFAGGSTPLRTPTPLPPVPVEVVDPLTVNETSVSLSIYSADVDVRLDKKVAAELLRSTKKNPPTKVKYELIYVRPPHVVLSSTYPSNKTTRRRKMNTTLAGKKMKSNPLLLVVFSKAYVQIWKGEERVTIFTSSADYYCSTGSARIFIVSNTASVDLALLIFL